MTRRFESIEDLKKERPQGYQFIFIVMVLNIAVDKPLDIPALSGIIESGPDWEFGTNA